MATRKDFERVATILKQEIDTISQLRDRMTREEHALRYGTIAVTADRFARSFSAENPRFDRSRFLKACGLEA